MQRHVKKTLAPLIIDRPDESEIRFLQADITDLCNLSRSEKQYAFLRHT